MFARIPRNLPQCPGGIGLTTAMVMLKTGWVIVGSAPSNDGTTATKGQGCLVILDDKGAVAGALINGPAIDAPWGNMAADRRGRREGDAVRQQCRVRASPRPTEDSPVAGAGDGAAHRPRHRRGQAARRRPPRP